MSGGFYSILKSLSRDQMLVKQVRGRWYHLIKASACGCVWRTERTVAKVQVTPKARTGPNSEAHRDQSRRANDLHLIMLLFFNTLLNSWLPYQVLTPRIISRWVAHQNPIAQASRLYNCILQRSFFFFARMSCSEQSTFHGQTSDRVWSFRIAFSKRCGEKKEGKKDKKIKKGKR